MLILSRIVAGCSFGILRPVAMLSTSFHGDHDMADASMVTLFRGGTRETTVDIADVQLPDVWKIVERLEEHFLAEGCPSSWLRDRKAILDCWHIAGALKKHVQKQHI